MPLFAPVLLLFNYVFDVLQKLVTYKIFKITIFLIKTRPSFTILQSKGNKQKKSRDAWKHRRTDLDIGIWNVQSMRQEGHIRCEITWVTRASRDRWGIKPRRGRDTWDIKLRRARGTGATWARRARMFLDINFLWKYILGLLLQSCRSNKRDDNNTTANK